MKRRTLITAVLVLAMLPITTLSASALDAIFIVNSTADASDVNPGDGVCETGTAGECTLRAAIEEANADPGTDTINFDIPGDAPYTISPSFGFDFIFDPVIIDGTTQPGFSGTPMIELEGSNAGTDAYGIVIYAGSSVVRGLVINRFALTGIDLNVKGSNIIQGNYIGTDVTGTLDLGNGVNGVSISQGSGGNVIGGITAEARNIISGNGEFGIIIVDPGSAENVMQGNFIGTDVTGSADLGNASVGIVIGAGANDNLVGGTDLGAGNLISGNDSAGVHIDSMRNRVQGNTIGTDITGTLELGNVFEGIFIGVGGSRNIVGGTKPSARNLISGNIGNGVTIDETGTTRNVVQGNYIGTDVTGTLSLGNSDNGILISGGATNNTVGGKNSAARNLISGNGIFGIAIVDPGTDENKVQGNFIGTDLSGMLALGNSASGILVADGAHNSVGGIPAQVGNTIAFNIENGILLYPNAGPGNSILSNSIFANGGLAIDLGEDGVTPNDQQDVDTGPNDLQNYPNLTSAEISKTGSNHRQRVEVQGVLRSTPRSTFTIQFFSDVACDPSNFGEGKFLIGATRVRTDKNGRALFHTAFTATLAQVKFITATATDSNGNTSEFSQCQKVG